MPKTAQIETTNLLTVDEVATRLRLSVRSIYRLIDAGDLRIHRLGRSIRISESDLATWLKTTRD